MTVAKGKGRSECRRNEGLTVENLSVRIFLLDLDLLVGVFLILDRLERSLGLWSLVESLLNVHSGASNNFIMDAITLAFAVFVLHGIGRHAHVN